VLGRLRTASRAGPHPRVRVLSDVAGFVAEVTGHAIEPEAPWLARLLSGQRLEEVARAVNRPIAELIREIGRRELAGELVRLPGGRYGRAARVK